MRKWMLAGCITGACTICGTAAAQVPGFGAQGQLAISAERLFGVEYAKSSYDGRNGAPGGYTSGTIIGFGWTNQGRQSSFVEPRAGIDYFVMNSLSLGGAIGIYSHSGHDTADGVSGFLFAPRVGYAIDLGSVASFWPRGGITYYSHGDYHNLGITGEANFALFPRPNWSFLIQPHFDVGPFGDVNGQGYTEFAIGGQFGIMGVI
jgi:hypothetical protein